ncbi:glycosyltransferase involved in cell wall biosynthesis [Homoserinimonas aerilata]|uniref:Glycosyltransferase involved in cell wall biosynthesis n=1 Tax=Homoserinimonas aerilata TaxID=1162970 RepID=A0A542YL20_9MICO|nr:glycosyltransferase involved in cell wall biosynthesis [Homoserinimonas aerilata]
MSRLRQRFVDSRATVKGSAVKDGGQSAVTKFKRTLSWLARSQVFHSIVHLLRSRALRSRLERLCELEKPDIVHALRIPYEGVTALDVHNDIPVVLSTWGSDFVPQASSDPLLARWIRRRLHRASGYQYDAHEDLLRAGQYGLDARVPALYAAGNFGVDLELFFVEQRGPMRTVVYPRRATPNSNFRGFVAAAISLQSLPNTRFIGVGLASIQADMESEFGRDAVARLTLTGNLSRKEMAELMRSADVVVSPTFWDGTPLTVLEALASGARVVAGDLAELRELQSQGLAIDLINAGDTTAIASGIRRALEAVSVTAEQTVLPAPFNRAANVSRVTDFYTRVLLASKSA